MGAQVLEAVPKHRYSDQYMSERERTSGVQPGTGGGPAQKDSARIIYMGDVRRRRGKQRQAPDKHYLGAVGLVALSAWSIWVTVLFSLEPARLLTYLAFFLPLAVALAATGTLAAYWMEWKMGGMPSLRISYRRGALFALALTANLALAAGHKWSPVTAIVVLLLAGGAEAAASRRV